MDTSYFQLAVRLAGPLLLLSGAKAGLDALVRTVKKDDLERASLSMERTLRKFSWRSYIEALTIGGVSADIGVFVKFAREGETTWITQYRELPLYLIAIHIGIYAICLHTHKLQDVSLIGFNEQLGARMDEGLESYQRKADEAKLEFLQAKSNNLPLGEVRKLEKQCKQAEVRVQVERKKIRDLSGLSDLKKKFHRLSWLFPPCSWLLGLIVLGGQ